MAFQSQASCRKDKVKGKGKLAGEPTTKAIWDAEANAVFIKLCVDQVRAGNRPLTYFNKIGWHNIMSKFTEITGKKYSRIQMKNRWDVLKRDWGLWQSLKKGETGVRWNPGKGTIEASDSWWQNKLQSYPDAAKLRERGLPHADELDICFADAAAVGEQACIPLPGVMPLRMKYMEGGDESEEVPDDDNAPDEFTPEMKSPVEGPINQHKEPVSRREKVSGAAKLSRPLDCIVESVASSSATSIKNDSFRCGIMDCLKALADIPGVVPGDPLYILGARLFVSHSQREVFMALPDSEVRRKYLLAEQQYQLTNAPRRDAWD